MADIELVIKIPEEAKQAFDCAENNDLKGGYYDHGGVIGNAIKNGTPLPKGHGRLIDADEVKKQYPIQKVDAIPLSVIDEIKAEILKYSKEHFENDENVWTYIGIIDKCVKENE